MDDNIGAAVACRKIGENYCDLQDYEKALQFQQRHLNLAKKCDNLIEEQRAWATIGNDRINNIQLEKKKSLRFKRNKIEVKMLKKILV